MEEKEEPKQPLHGGKALAKQLVTYADAITAFSFVQSAAFGSALAQHEFRESLLKLPGCWRWGILGAYLVYGILVGVCWYGSSELLRDSNHDAVTDKWTTYMWFGRVGVILLAAVLSVLAIHFTIEGAGR
jgi:hypothetical protein